MSSTPSLTEFDPGEIPFQKKVINDVRLHFDYTKGVHEVLLSGSVGSAKSLLMAHVIVTHCLINPGAQALIGRKALKHLRRTLLDIIIKHLDKDIPFKFNKSESVITFPNGSRILAHSWDDGDYKKVRSYELSCVGIDELTETDNQEFYDEIRMRVERLPHVKENLIIAATNPDSPSHWAYQYFIEKQSDTRKVYYSRTEQNQFLSKSYIDNLKSTLDPKMARRMLYGEWIEIRGEVVYYNYDQSRNFRDYHYQVTGALPIQVCFDFNIGEGKPLSICFMQYDGHVFHIFNEVVVEGYRTMDALDEMSGRGLLDYPCEYIIHGDATGAARTTKAIHSDYDIIKKFFANHPNNLNWRMDVPRANPPIKERHNTVNSLCQNELGDIRLFVYKDAPTVDKGLRLTRLKKGGNYIEDDSDPWQHVTTALGYGIISTIRKANIPKARNI